jgi:hypothetical protein
MPFLTAIALLLVLIPGAEACSYCGMSMVNLLFPFMWKALWILVPWRLIYLYLQLAEIKARPFGFFGNRLIGLAALCFGFNLAGFFLYLMGSFARALLRFVCSLIKPIPEQSIRPALVLHSAALFFLIPLVVLTYIRYGKLDNLDRLRECVYPGSSQSRFIAMKIAEDPQLNLYRIQEMLVSGKFGDLDKASEILRIRKSADDLIALQDTILNMPDKEISWGNRNWPEWTGFYFTSWLEGVTGKEIKTKEELRAWIAGEETRRKAASSVAGEGNGASATHPHTMLK